MTPGPGDGPYFCSGGVPCAYTTNVVPLAIPTAPPEPGKQWQVLICYQGGTFTKQFVQTGGTQPRPLIVQAQEAYGNLAPPTATVRHSPDARGIVGLATWLWLAPGTFGPLRGSSAEGWSRWPSRTARTGPPATAARCPAPAPASRTDRPAAATARTRTAARRPATTARSPGPGGCTTSRAATRIDIPGAPVTLTANTAWALAVAEAQVLTGESPGR